MFQGEGTKPVMEMAMEVGFPRGMVKQVARQCQCAPELLDNLGLEICAKVDALEDSAIYNLVSNSFSIEERYTIGCSLALTLGHFWNIPTPTPHTHS